MKARYFVSIVFSSLLFSQEIQLQQSNLRFFRVTQVRQERFSGI